MNILDQDRFDMEQPRWRELVRALAALCPAPGEALSLTHKRKRDVTPGMSPLNMWTELLSLVAPEGRTRETVEAVFRRFGSDQRAAFLEDLLSGKEEASSAELVTADGAEDGVFEIEALLFLDDLTMPAGKIAGLVETLRKLLDISPAVCLLRIETTKGSLYGTGFRIGEDIVLTNHHVLAPDRRTVTAVFADFGFDVDDAGVSTPVVSLRGNLSTIMGETEDDWAVIGIGGMSADIPIVDLHALPEPVVGEPAFIIQHPEGRQKRLGFVRNKISDVEEGIVKYLTDTQRGSSGAPVFDASARPIALHYAGGKPIELAGKAPVAKNRGIRMSRVVTRLKAHGLLR